MTRWAQGDPDLAAAPVWRSGSAWRTHPSRPTHPLPPADGPPERLATMASRPINAIIDFANQNLLANAPLAPHAPLRLRRDAHPGRWQSRSGHR
jgi:hypothetical protein